MVLDKGEIAECGMTTSLLSNRYSIFHGMVKEAGLL